VRVARLDRRQFHEPGIAKQSDGPLDVLGKKLVVQSRREGSRVAIRVDHAAESTLCIY